MVRWRIGSDKLGASVENNSSKAARTHFSWLGHLVELIAVLVPHLRLNVLVQPGRAESASNRQERIHAIGGLVDLIVLVRTGVVLSKTHNEDEDVGEALMQSGYRRSMS